MGPVRTYSIPSYPTRTEFVADPRLLIEHQPPGWLAPGMAGAVSLLLATGTGCLPRPAALLVAPVFQHGEGRGAVGCMAITAPSFMSEADALQTIQEELARVGVHTSAHGVEWVEVVVPHRREVGRRIEEVPGRARPLVVDGVDARRAIAFTFVSRSRYYELGGAQGDSTVQGYDMPEVARYVAGKVRDQRRAPGAFGVFYDPVPREPRLTEEDLRALKHATTREAAMRAVSGPARRLLREQVKDFVDWLKAQGAI
jgi:hypothetical protein